ncbi:MAG: ATP-binding cassette domain-containing protein [Geminicoccaceae bacterium]
MDGQPSGSGEIRLVDVTKTFGDMHAVKSIDLTIPHGSYCCLVGPSGCGKTTILRMIAGHRSPTSGPSISATRWSSASSRCSAAPP